MENILSEISVTYRSKVKSSVVIKSSLDAHRLLRDLFSEDTIELKEEAYCLYLNRSNRVLGWYKLSSGGMTGTVVDIRLILGVALKVAACGIILCHNHPSGFLKASSADIELTGRIKQAAALMDVKFLDHVIITSESYLSFGDEGLL